MAESAILVVDCATLAWNPYVKIRLSFRPVTHWIPLYKQKEFLAIFEETRAEWSIAGRAAYTQNLVVFTVYANLGEEALVYALNQGEIQYMVVNQANLKMVGKIVDQVKSLKHLIVVDSKQAAAADISNLKGKGLVIHSFEDVEAEGASNPLPPTPPQPNDLASIQYTSVRLLWTKDSQSILSYPPHP